MKTIIKFSATAVLFLFCFQLTGQQDPPETGTPVTIKSGHETPKQAPVGSPENSGTGIYGSNTSLGDKSALYFNDWSPGTVVLTDNTIITDRMLRYDIYHRQMQFAYNGDTAAFGKPEEVKSITFGEYTFVYDEFICKEGKRKDYLEVLAEGPCRLFVYRCINYKYVDDCAIPGAENPREEFYQAKKYLFSKNNEIATSMPENKNDVIELFSDKDLNIKKFIHENKIKLDDEQDLIKLVNYYNGN
jgi:hypothetical protein